MNDFIKARNELEQGCFKSLGVDLVVHVGPVALVRAEHRGERRELGPPQQELLAAVVVHDRVGHRGVTTDIAVVERVAGHPAGEHARDRGTDTDLSRLALRYQPCSR